MELTKEQIHEVEIYLKNKNFDFIDLKIEILDHIISDIENLLLKEDTFEDAFAMTRIRWEKHFRETSSFYFGLQFSESKIVVKKAIKLFKPFYFLYLVACILPFIFLQLKTIKVDENTAFSINKILTFVAVIVTVYMAIVIVKTIQTKVKTTYRFILKTQYLGVVLLLLAVFVGVFNDKGEMYPAFGSFACASFMVVFICHHFYKKHKEAIKKYKIS